MLRKTFLLALCAVALGGLVSSCCKSSSGLQLTYDGAKDKAMDVSAGWAYATTKTFSWPDGSGGFKTAKAASHSLYLANFALDPSRGVISLSSALTADGQMRVSFGLVGGDGTEAGGKERVAPAKGDYRCDVDKFSKVDWVEITVFEGGKETKHRFDKPTGTIQVTASDPEEITGVIDVKDAKNAVKGGFSAKLTK